MRKVPKDAPTSFVKKRWESLVFTDDGVDRQFYELYTLAELKNALRAGDIWVQGSRQFKDFDEYLLPTQKFASLRFGDSKLCSWRSPWIASRTCVIGRWRWNSN